MTKYSSARQRNLKVGIVSYTESNTVLQVTGRVGIGTTNASTNLDVAGDIRLRGGIYDNNNTTGLNSYVPIANGAGGWSWQPVTSAGAGTLSGITIEDEGSTVGFAGSVTTINFVGLGVTATVSGAGATVSFTPVQGIQGTTGTQGLQGVQGFSFNRVDTTFTATGGQTTFSVNYSVGNVDVYLNGARLSANDYTATNGTSVVLTVGASSGDVIDVLAFESAGPQGTTGTQGTAGVIGFDGSQGTQGVQGIQGIQGVQGTTGSQGFSFNRTTTSFNTTDGQTTFSVNYSVGNIDVYLNGNRLSSDDYTATNGTSVVLSVGASSGDRLDVVAFESAGPQGTTGAQGTVGTNGPQGTTGAQGLTGSQGFSFNRTTNTFTATEGQTTFAVNYSLGNIEVFLNGTRLNGNDYTATNGTSIVLNVAASAGDIIDTIAFVSAGPQGLSGTQGTQGTTGAGTQGTQGIQGTVGIQGTIGTTPPVSKVVAFSILFGR